MVPFPVVLGVGRALGMGSVDSRDDSLWGLFSWGLVASSLCQVRRRRALRRMESFWLRVGLRLDKLDSLPVLDLLFQKDLYKYLEVEGVEFWVVSLSNESDFCWAKVCLEKNVSIRCFGFF